MVEGLGYLKFNFKLKLFICILLLLVIPPSIRAQFVGGSNDGFDSRTIVQTVCSDNTPNFVYIGGNGDGKSNNTLIQNNCPDLSPNFVYYGGSNDGSASNDLVQGNCPDLTPNFVYYGGSNDGFSSNNLVQGICPDLTPYFVYYGGSNDGFTSNNLVQGICPDLTPYFVYYGGNSDGFSWNYRQATPCTPIPSGLPIELISFSAMCNDLNVKLIWSTAAEINNDFFTLERSSDGIIFKEIAQIDGSGTINKITNYYYTDLDAGNGLVYYRLKQTDYDGTTNNSIPINIKCDAGVSDWFMVYPNPAKSELNIEFFEENTNMHFEIIDAQGRLVYESDIINKTKITTENYSKGVYVIKLTNHQSISPETYSYQKFIKE